MLDRGILGSGRTRGVSFWPFPNSSCWWWLISSVFLIRISCHKTTHADGYYGAWPGWAVSISVLPLTVATGMAFGPWLRFGRAVLQKVLLSFFSFSILGGFPGGSDGKESACKVGKPGSIPGLGRSLGEGNGHDWETNFRFRFKGFISKRNHSLYTNEQCQYLIEDYLT